MLTNILRWFIRFRLAAFERSYDYDVSYLRDILTADLGAFLKFTRLTAISRHRKGVPRDAWYAARLIAALAEDCGPCTQLVATMAERAGVDAALLTAILARDELAMTEDVRLAARFARAVIAHDDAADPLRAEVVARWGAKGLVSLGLAITASRLYPTLKYALGHGRTCRRIVVAGAPVAVAKDRVIDATSTSS